MSVTIFQNALQYKTVSTFERIILSQIMRVWKTCHKLMEILQQ